MSSPNYEWQDEVINGPDIQLIKQYLRQMKAARAVQNGETLMTSASGLPSWYAQAFHEELRRRGIEHDYEPITEWMKWQEMSDEDSTAMWEMNMELRDGDQDTLDCDEYYAAIGKRAPWAK